MRRGEAKRHGWRVETLEVRALMAATFAMPTVPGGGRDVAATFDRMVGSLQAQIAIQAPKNTAPAKLTQVVNEVVDGFEAASRSAFAGSPRTVSLLVGQGEALRASIDSLKQQLDVGAIKTSTFDSSAYMAINELTLSRQVWPAGTPLQTFLVLATETSDGLDATTTFVQTTSAVTDAQAAAVLKSQALAFQTQADLGASRQPGVARTVDQATATYIAQIDAAVGQPDFGSRIATAAAGFAAALVEPGGAFGPGGTFGRLYAQPPVVPTPLAMSDAATFAHLQYRQVDTTRTMTLFRNFAGADTRYGRFMTTDQFRSPIQAVRKLALDQSWYGTNQAWYVENVTIPAGTLVYVGRVAPIYQGIFSREATPKTYPGMAVQYLVANTRAPGIVWDDFRATGA